jgi:hypothetical protein
MAMPRLGQREPRTRPRRAPVALVLSIAIGACQPAKFQAAIGSFGADDAFGVVATSDGGFATVGSTSVNVHGGLDVYLVRVSPAGLTMWTRAFGGSPRRHRLRGHPDRRRRFRGGRTHHAARSFAGLLLLKTDANGTEEWSRTFTDPELDPMTAQGLRETAAGGYLIAGSVLYGVYGGQGVLLRADESGNEEWRVLVGGSAAAAGGLVFGAETGDGGYLVSGTVRSSFVPGYSYPYVAKLASDRSPVWTTYPSASLQFTSLTAMHAAADGSTVAAGVGTGIGPSGFSSSLLLWTFDPDGHETSYRQGFPEGSTDDPRRFAGARRARRWLRAAGRAMRSGVVRPSRPRLVRPR